MTTDTIIIIEYESGKSEWRPSTVETLAHIAASFDCIAGVQELEAGERLFDYPSFDAARTALALSHARRELRQAKAQKLQAVKVLVGVDECCGECRANSENEAQQHS